MPVVHSKTRARECKLSDSQAFRQSRRGAVESKRLCCQCRAWPVLGKSAAAKQEDQLLRLVLGRDKAVSDTKRIEKLIQELSAQPVSKVRKMSECRDLLLLTRRDEWIADLKPSFSSMLRIRPSPERATNTVCAGYHARPGVVGGQLRCAHSVVQRDLCARRRYAYGGFN